MKKVIALTVVAFLGCVAQSQAEFHAINDMGGSSGSSTTNYSLGSNFSGAQSGLLKNFTTDTYTTVTLTVSTPAGATEAQWDSGTSNGALANAGTDAYNLFNGKLNALGYLWYNDTTTSRVRLTFSGLSAGATYSVALFGNRNGAYSDRYTITELVGADSFSNTSSTGATISGALTTVMTGNNTTAGILAQYSDIAAGVDGSFYVDVYGLVQGTNTHKWYLNGLSLTETDAVPEPASFGLLALAGLAIAAKRRRA